MVYANDGIERDDSFKLYAKKKIDIGYIKSTDIAEKGTDCRIRTLEGDVFIKTSDDVYLMVGYLGEVYPIERDTLMAKYDLYEEAYTKAFEYNPSMRNLVTDEVYELMPYAKRCVSRNSAKIYAKQLDKATKVFTKWDYEKYMLGKIDDYIAVAYDDDKDIYIIDKNVFEQTYELV